MINCYDRLGSSLAEARAHARASSRREIRNVERFAPRRLDRLPDVPDRPIARDVAESVTRAVDLARTRLENRLPSSVLVDADRYFEKPAIERWDVDRRPEVDRSDLIGEICAQPRSVSFREKAAGLQLELRAIDEEVQAEALGDLVEPGSDVLSLDPQRLAAVAAANTSIELRQFDRQCPGWAPFADDLATVTGADVFLKLFVADGNRSVNGWHRDGSDVLVTVIHGAKRFAVADERPGRPDGQPEPVVDVVLRPGDALRLPRAMLHCATPNTGLSALLSMGLMRTGDWPYRQVPPTHLGFRDYPRSTALYRLCLRPHTALVRLSDLDGRVPMTVRSRLPGGVRVLDVRGDTVSFVAAGSIFESDVSTVRALAVLHGSAGLDATALAAATDLPESTCRESIASLLAHGLIGT